MHLCCPPGFASFLSNQNQLSKIFHLRLLWIWSMHWIKHWHYSMTYNFIIQSDSHDTLNTHRTLDLASSLEVGAATNPATGDAASCYSARSVLTIAFQFPFEDNLQENVATMARQYVRSVVSSVQRVAMAISPSGVNPTLGSKLSPASPEAVTLSHWICQSYR